MLRPTPSSRISCACSKISHSMPSACRLSAVVRPPMPPPMISTLMIPSLCYAAAMKPKTIRALSFILLSLACVTTHAATATPTIQTEDVDRFFKLYDANGGHPTAEQIQHDYLDAGTEGLHNLARLRNVTGTKIADTLTKRPEIYVKARDCVAVLPRVRERVKAALDNLIREYPAARTPSVTIAVGRGKPVGVGSPVTGVQIGLEALCGTDFMNPDLEDRFVYVIAHEYAHVQQVPELVDGTDLTVLQASLMEGAADFVGELISGHVSYAYLATMTAGREKEIESRFVPDLDKKDLSDWVNNSTPEKPADLGYWVGYRICKAYYQRATDKTRALKEILELRVEDTKAFLKESGWYPGVALK